MTSFLAQHQGDLARLCRAYHVRRLEVFGSAARTDFSPGSDVDLIVQFDKQSGLDRFEQYFGFKESLERLFGREVDLLEAGAIENRYFLKAIEAERELMYGD